MDLNMLMQMLLGGKGKQKNGMNPQMMAQMFGMGGGGSFGGFGGTGAGASQGMGGSGNPAAIAKGVAITDADAGGSIADEF